jgi:hypothetical protein
MDMDPVHDVHMAIDWLCVGTCPVTEMQRACYRGPLAFDVNASVEC